MPDLNAEAINSSQKSPYPSTDSEANPGLCPLLPSQMDIWLASQMDLSNSQYNGLWAIHIRGKLNRQALDVAFREIVMQQEAFSTRFVEVDGIPYRTFTKENLASYTTLDLDCLSFEQRESYAKLLLRALAATPFALVHGLCWRAVLIRFSSESHVFALSTHHLLADGASFSILLNQLRSKYAAHLAELGSTRSLERTEVSASTSRQRYAYPSIRETDIAYWRKELAGVQRLDISLPTTLNTCAIQTVRHATTIPNSVMATLLHVSKELKATPFTLLVAALGALLSRLCGHSEFLMGVIISGRNDAALRDVIGCFVRTVPIKVSVQSDDTLASLVVRAKGWLAGAFRHQSTPLHEIVAIDREVNGATAQALLAVVVSHQKKEPQDSGFGNCLAEPFVVDLPGNRFDLDISFIESESAKFVCEGAPLGWGDAFAKLFSERFEVFLSAAVREPTAPLSSCPVCGPTETLLQQRWNATTHPFPSTTVHDLIREQAEKTPVAIAVEFEEEALTYQELDQLSNQIAHHLLECGCQVETRVAVCFERRLDAVALLLGIMKSGGMYVPLDPQYPEERLRFIVDDANVEVLLVEERLQDRFAGFKGTLISLGDLRSIAPQYPRSTPSVSTGPQFGAYVIYTSGSTGQPKGALLEHNAVVNRLTWMQDAYPLGESDRILQKTSFGFDVSVWELFWPLICGARVVMAAPGGQRDNAYLVRTIQKYGITTIHFVPSMFDVFLLDKRVSECTTLTKVFCSGEALQAATAERFKTVSGAQLINLYGPTEAAVDVTHWASDSTKVPRAIPIGRPISNIQMYVLDRDLSPVPIGATGDLYIGGAGLSRGYIGRPDLTAERFIPNPVGNERGGRLYKTGDLARWLPSGDLDFCGRSDFQAKVRGYRIELGEIETRLRECRDILQALVQVQESTIGDKQLVAYVVTTTGEGAIEEWKNALREKLPEYMVPAFFMILAGFPLNSSGKVDRKALPSPFARKAILQATAKHNLDRPMSSGLESTLLRLWSDLLGGRSVGIHDRFFDVGGNSLLVLRMRSRLQERLGIEIAVTEFFRHPTVESLAKYINGLKSQETDGFSDQPSADSCVGIDDQTCSDGAIAIIGMALRVPGANTVEQFWDNLRNGIESVSFLSDDELLGAGVPAEALKSPHYVRAYRPVEDCDLFDAEFFGYSPREAEITDPQHRILLECAWEALESANVDPTYSNPIGVFAAQGSTSYLSHLLEVSEETNATGRFQFMLANDKDHLPMRISYKLGLTGPSVAVQTACSSSLAAVHLARQSLLGGDCDVALAAGVRVSIPQARGYLYQEGGIASPDGHCRAFDMNAEGTVGGNGAGVVVLKRLGDAIRDGDKVRAVILGSAINNDGGIKLGYTAPSSDGQAAVIRKAISSTGVNAETISYIEAHGTGTKLGDPIEIEALNQAFGDVGRNYCGVGSVKTNIGHLDVAAGVVGLIKSVLALEHGELPPSLNYAKPNPAICFSSSPFYVVDHLKPWKPVKGFRRAGVSSFGMGGTNVHLILEEAPTVGAAARSTREWEVLPLSARNPAALNELSKRLACHIEQHPDVPFVDIARTLQIGRKHHSVRRAIVSDSRQDAVLQLNRPAIFKANGPSESTRTAFLFPGQGTQRIQMALPLYRTERVFKETLDECAELALKHVGVDLRSVVYPSAEKHTEASNLLSETWITQPALFIVEYSLARLWMHWGLTPSALMGHSLGEYVAACLADVFSLADALKLVASRGRLMHDTPTGGMLVVRQDRTSLKDFEIAAVNMAGQSVVTGPLEAVEDLERTLVQRGEQPRWISKRYAFHSSLMDTARERFLDVLRDCSFHSPRIPLLSNLTGEWISEPLCCADYWADQLRQPVLFSKQLKSLVASGHWILLELGPGRTLTGIARRECPDCLAVASLGETADEEELTIAESQARIWSAGIDFNWSSISSESAQRAVLPSYPFQHKRYWYSASQAPVPSPSIGKATEERCLFRGFWHDLGTTPILSGPSLHTLLVISDEVDEAKRISVVFGNVGTSVIHATYGSRYERKDAFSYSLDRRSDNQISLLKASLAVDGISPDLIVLSTTSHGDADIESGESGVRAAAVLLDATRLFRQIGETFSNSDVSVTLLVSGAYNVSGAEIVDPFARMLSILPLVASQEYPHLHCSLLDLGSKADVYSARSLKLLPAAIKLCGKYRTLALRGARYWRPRYEPIEMEQGRGLLRQGGTYLITGGTGKLGQALARYLAEMVKANLILLARSPDDASDVKQQLEKLGAAVCIVHADVGDMSQLTTAVHAGTAILGRIHGVFHLAATTAADSFTPLERTDELIIERHLRSKVDGTLNLDHLFANQALDFCVLYSSVASIYGGVGYGAYAAANGFLDAFADYRSSIGNTPWISIGWSAWDTQEINSSFSSPNVLAKPVALKSLTEILEGGISGHVIVSKVNPEMGAPKAAAKRNDASIQDSRESPLSEVDETDSGASQSTELTSLLAHLWESLLGCNDIQPTDDFFALGGDSILSLQLASRLAELSIDVTPRQIFENPTVAQLAELISLDRASKIPNVPPSATHDALVQ